MYRRYAVKFHNNKAEFINCVNMVERIKKARSLPEGMRHLGVDLFVSSSQQFGKKEFFSVKNKD